MKVIRLTAQNFMRLSAVEIAPTGEIVKISGANGQGKTSVINAIWAALELSRLNIEQPIKGGAKKAAIRLDLGEVKIERTITKSGGELKVYAADGVRIDSPQTFLRSLIGELSFDPLEFDRMKPADQVDALRRIVKLDIDFDAIARENQRDFDRRTEVNRQAKQKRAAAEAIPIAGPALPPYDTTAILNDLQNAAQHNADLEKRKAKRAQVLKEAEDAEKEAERLGEEMEQLRLRIVGLGQARDAALENAKACRERLHNAPPLPDPIDVAVMRGKLDEANAMNAKSERARERQRLEAEATELENQATGLGDAIDARKAAAERALAETKMPVPGLSFGEAGVLLNGFPFAQASAAERLRAGMAIAMAANPKIRVIRITDGSLLDSKSMAIIGELARDNDFQVWVEVVDESKQIGFVIEDGAVAAVNE